ncbi:hypothetical protein [Alistipes sp.]|uniref:hypothetical protein n=1 Tax=Alistipes sp. TaxID=1872444 RepID=UPI0025BE956D|nr:hypothetical protein [Alistipes sp.]
MNKFFQLILCGLLLPTACSKDFDGPEPAGGGQGITLSIVPDRPMTITSRAEEGSDIADDTCVEHIIIYAFNGDGTLYQRFQQNLGSPTLEGDNAPVYKIQLLLKSPNALHLAAVCNYPELWDKSGNEDITLSELRHATFEGQGADCAFQGLMIMSGEVDLSVEEMNDRGAHLQLIVKRISSKVEFTVNFDPEVATDQFLLSGVKICNIPLRSHILEAPANYVVDTEGNYDGAQGDAVHETIPQPLPENYSPREDFYLAQASLKTSPAGEHSLQASFYLFENRRGRKNDLSYFKKEYAQTRYYQTLMGRLGQEEYPTATYLLVEGIYISGNGKRTEHVAYRIYVGQPQPYDANTPNNDQVNFNDFNVCRNSHYRMTTTIRAADDIDTRISAQLLTRSTITPFFNTPLDAHYGTGMCYAYTGNRNWELYVEEPDLHPWLEISLSPRYRPRLAGEVIPDDQRGHYACTHIESRGNALSQYFYIHTDEYIPENPSADENANLHNGVNIALDEASWRTGYVVLRDKENNSVCRFKVQQRPAQVVRMPLTNALGHPTGEYNEYYVEYELERTGLQFGFLRYGANPVMTSMINDRWDGLANTRRLYEEAIKPGGAYNPRTSGSLLHPIYKYDTPEEAARALPDNAGEDLIGYMTTKNRDRNGNGYIDYDEIEWYVPAVDELAYLWEVISRGHLCFENDEGRFHSSTPYLAGYTAEVPGRSFYVKTSNGKKKAAFTMRDRQYNIICCRRKNAWTGKPDGGIDGHVEVDTDWGADENDLLPKQ